MTDFLDAKAVNGVAGACGGLTRTLNLVVNDENKGLRVVVPNLVDLVKNFNWGSFVWNIATGGIFGYIGGSDPLNAFEIGFVGNYITTKGLQTVARTAK